MNQWKIILVATALLITALAVKAFAEPLFFVFNEQKTCSLFHKTAPCQVRCGNFKWREAAQEYRWTDCPIMERIFQRGAQPTPVPTASPRPSAGPTPCTGTPCDCGLKGWCATQIFETDTVLCARCNLGQK